MCIDSLYSRYRICGVYIECKQCINSVYELDISYILCILHDINIVYSMYGVHNTYIECI